MRIAAGFLSITYGIGALVTVFLEYRRHLFSERFELPPELIYLVCAVQLGCAIGVLLRKFAPWSAAVLTVITLGAIASHLRIGSPLTTLPAVFYSVVQVWFGIRSLGAKTQPDP